MPKPENVHNSVKCSQNFTKRQSGHLQYVPKQYAWYRDPSSSSSPDILLIRLLYYTKCQSRKREITQPNIYRILSNVNQVIYTLDTICMPNFMILSQVVLQIFCWQGPLCVKCLSRKSEIIQSNIYRISRKVNRIIYTLDTMYISNFMIIVQAVLQNICWQDLLWVTCKCLSRKRGTIQSNIHRILRKVNQVIYIMYLNFIIDAIVLAQAVLQIFCWQDCFTIRHAKVGKGR